MSDAGYISAAFSKVSQGWKDQLGQRLGDLAFEGAKDRSPEAQEKLWRRVNRLLKLGADVNVHSKNPNSGRTAFAQIIWGGYDIVVARMLEAGADPNLPEAPKSKITPFVAAATMRDVGMMRAMVARGADVTATNEEGDNALHEMLTHILSTEDEASRKDVRDAYDFLTQECGLTLEDKTLKHIFTEAPYVAFVDPKLEAAQALWSATISKDHDKMRALLSAGAPPDSARDYGHNTALHYAITGNDREAIRLLISARAKPDFAESSLGDIDTEMKDFMRSLEKDRDDSLVNVTAGKAINVGRALRLKIPGSVS